MDFEKLVERLSLGEVRTDVMFKDITTLGIGGKIKCFFEPNDLDGLKTFLFHAKNVKIFIIGNGSNVFASDEDFAGIVISLKKMKKTLYNYDNYFYLSANVSLNNFVNYAIAKNCTEMEFLATIPGQVGGAITMNAGAYGSSIEDILVGCECLTLTGELIYLSNKDLHFSYRHSLIQNEKLIVINAIFKLEPSTDDDSREIIANRKKIQLETRPLNYRNAGSTFKNNEIASWKLVSDVGLRGYKINDAMVSELHANFIINLSEAKSADVIKIIEDIKIRVKEHYNLNLQIEWKKVNF